MKKLYAYYCKAEEIITGIGFVTIIVLVFSSAIARGLKNPIQWTVDISQLLLAWVSFFGADVAWRHSQILGLDLFTKNLPIRLRKVKYPRQSRGLEFVNRSKRFLLFVVLSHPLSLYEFAPLPY
ncbi:MAG: TRAP transporter small permease subunit, partial [Treponema sp.]|nr:TRAP transporter small permease subunit [Treponema sp.]